MKWRVPSDILVNDLSCDLVQIDLTMCAIGLSGRDLVSYIDRSIHSQDPVPDVACLDSEDLAGAKSCHASETEDINIPVGIGRTFEQPPDVRRLKNDLFFLRGRFWNKEIAAQRIHVFRSNTEPDELHDRGSEIRQRLL